MTVVPPVGDTGWRSSRFVPTNRLAVERPSPVPRDFVVKNGVKRASRAPPAEPGPLSATAIAYLIRRPTRTRMRPSCTA